MFFDEFPNVNVDTETTSPADNYNDDLMNAVSTRRLIINQATNLLCCPTGLPRCLGHANAP
jgi:hypothetical protein